MKRIRARCVLPARKAVAASLLLSILLGGCVTDVGRYQLMSRGDSDYLYKIDTTTGRVYYNSGYPAKSGDWRALVPLNEQQKQ